MFLDFKKNVFLLTMDCVFVHLHHFFSRPFANGPSKPLSVFHPSKPEVERSLKTTAASCESSSTFGTGWCGAISATFERSTENFDNDGGRVVKMTSSVWRFGVSVTMSYEDYRVPTAFFLSVKWMFLFFKWRSRRKRGSLGEWTGKRRMFAIELLQLGYNYIH